MRTYLAGGMSLTSNQRRELEGEAGKIEAALTGTGGDEARAVLLSKLLMAYPSSGTSERMVEARVDAYRDALCDIPPWAIQQAIKKWHRGEAGEGHNYSFAPAPAVLRNACERVVAPWRDALRRVNGALNALTIDRAIDPEPIVVVTLRQMGAA